ncbi:MAG: 16S rRNA (cytosine(1402)-N(4))-methyltransferase RsmH [Phycisphaerales bacterium]|nr:16S rRNA (cytosine(1402)-N(4))-methyltransferase RsmH [Phycisphaerales bacterium]
MVDEVEQHLAVLPDEVGSMLAIEPGACVVDCTLGLAGHAKMLASAAGPDGMVIGLDVDPDNLAIASQRMEESGCPHRLVRSNFDQLDEVLKDLGIGGVDAILADLGVSSNQISEPRFGLSFQVDAPLDMRLDDRLADTAADLVNRLGETELANLIYEFGQERFSRRIAKLICRERRSSRIVRTGQLVDLIGRALHVDPNSRRSKIHPATRTFQALRIAVNDELGALKRLLDMAPSILIEGGRIAIISFHSLEDGIVKRSFRAHRTDGIYDILTKKPLVAGSAERRANPRSRSAKLRVAKRTAKVLDVGGDGR